MLPHYDFAASYLIQIFDNQAAHDVHVVDVGVEVVEVHVDHHDEEGHADDVVAHEVELLRRCVDEEEHHLHGVVVRHHHVGEVVHHGAHFQVDHHGVEDLHDVPGVHHHRDEEDHQVVLRDVLKDHCDALHPLNVLEVHHEDLLTHCHHDVLVVHHHDDQVVHHHILLVHHTLDDLHHHQAHWVHQPLMMENT